MSRTNSEIVGDSIALLEAILSGEQVAGNGDVDRNVGYINNLLSMENSGLDEDTQEACRNILKRVQKTT